MNNFYPLFLLMLLPFSYSAQSKKKQILTLTNRIDSLNQVINQKEVSIETKNKTINDLNVKISNCNLTNDVKQQKIEFLKAKIKNLNDSIFKLVQQLPKNFKFPYKYGKKNRFWRRILFYFLF
jgi:chromosome segregation ATPase